MGPLTKTIAVIAAVVSVAGASQPIGGSTLPPEGVKGAQYVGSSKCRPCHLKEYKSWLETRHAHALENLGKADAQAVKAWAAKLKVQPKGPPDKADECVVCHTTGFQLAGGYPAADAAKNASLGFVGCESCHGAGGRHATAAKTEKKRTIQKGTGEAVCKRCHTAAVDPKFVMAADRTRGVHAVQADAPGSK
jgi:hypothetical protein